MQEKATRSTKPKVLVVKPIPNLNLIEVDENRNFWGAFEWLSGSFESMKTVTLSTLMQLIMKTK